VSSRISWSAARGSEPHPGLAHTLGMEVTVEGVESEAQLAQITDLQCDCAQGYLFSRPVDADAALTMLRSNSPQGSSPCGGRPAGDHGQEQSADTTSCAVGSA
jgi:hypothetical protein